MNPEKITAFLLAGRAALPGHKLIEKSQLRDGTWAFSATGKDCLGGGGRVAEIGIGTEDAGLLAFQVVGQCPIGKCAVEFVWLVREERWVSAEELVRIVKEE